MSKLTPMQKQRLIAAERTTGAPKLAEYILKYDNLDLSDFPGMDEVKRTAIEQELARHPDPAEQQDWDDIAAMLASAALPVETLVDRLKRYIDRWQHTLPNGNHVEEAKERLAHLEEQEDWDGVQAMMTDPAVSAQDKAGRLRTYVTAWQGSTFAGGHVREANEKLRELEEWIAGTEERDWRVMIDPTLDELYGFIAKYPGTVRKRELDTMIWGKTSDDDVDSMQRYIRTFPMGIHVNEAQRLIAMYDAWSSVAQDDIFAVNEFVRQYPKCEVAQQRLSQLKDDEIWQMKSNPTRYDETRFLDLLNEGIFSGDEIDREGIMSKGKINYLKNLKSKDLLPDMVDVINRSEADCEADRTDIYFWGIPSTGKSCVLMGLISSSKMNVKVIGRSGIYATALRTYCRSGVTISQTPGDFVTTMEGTISGDVKGREVNHDVNLVEMSGEEFAVKIADNPGAHVSFEDMGTGATRLLGNHNRKAFFIIIDPTVYGDVEFNAMDEQYNEQTGQKIYTTKLVSLSQTDAIEKIVQMFASKENSEIMERVDSINFIITKSDLLDSDRDEREKKALQLFDTPAYKGILNQLCKVCKRYNINMSNVERPYSPKLYTFSLGHFTIGGLYEYDSTDSDRLVDAIWNATRGRKEETFCDKMRRIFN